MFSEGIQQRECDRGPEAGSGPLQMMGEQGKLGWKHLS